MKNFLEKIAKAIQNYVKDILLYVKRKWKLISSFVVKNPLISIASLFVSFALFYFLPEVMFIAYIIIGYDILYRFKRMHALLELLISITITLFLSLLAITIIPVVILSVISILDFTVYLFKGEEYDRFVKGNR